MACSVSHLSSLLVRASHLLQMDNGKPRYRSLIRQGNFRVNNVTGRAGFGASTEGLVSAVTLDQWSLNELVIQWPYSYDSCDVGTLPNQTYPGRQTPLAAMRGGDPAADGELVRYRYIRFH